MLAKFRVTGARFGFSIVGATNFLGVGFGAELVLAANGDLAAGRPKSVLTTGGANDLGLMAA